MVKIRYYLLFLIFLLTLTTRSVYAENEEGGSTGAVIIQQPESKAAKIGSVVTFSIDADFVATTEASTGYRWQYSKDGSNWYDSTIESADSDCLAINVKEKNINNLYRCVVTGLDGISIESDPVRIIELQTGPENIEAYLGEIVSFTVASDYAYSYKWYYCKDEEQNWSPSTLEGCDTGTLTVEAKGTNTSLHYLYRCRLTDADGDIAYTEPVKIIKRPDLLILEPPEDCYASIGETTEFSVKVSAAEQYLWMYSEDGSNWKRFDEKDDSATAISFKVDQKNCHYFYKCTLVDKLGKEKDTKTVQVLSSVRIADQTRGPLYAAEKNLVSIKVEADNAASYQWYSIKDYSYNDSENRAEDQMDLLKKGNRLTSVSSKTNELQVSFEIKNAGLAYFCKITGKEGDECLSQPVIVEVMPEEVINVRDHGAVGDGVHDDTEALQEAFDQGEGKTVYIPEGTYLFSKTLEIKTNCLVFGDGPDSVLKLADQNELQGINWRSTQKYCMIILGKETDHCRLEKFCLEGQQDAYVNQGQFGIVVQGSNHTITNLTVHDINYFPGDWIGGNKGYETVNAPAFGLSIYDASNVHVNGGNFYNCGYECLGIEKSSNVVVSGAYCGTALRVPLQIHRNSDNIQIMNCVINNSDCPVKTTGGLTMHGVVDETIEHVLIYGCTITGGHIYGVQGGENYITIENCYIEKTVFNQEKYDSDHDWNIINSEIGGNINLHGSNMFRDGVDISKPKS